MSKVIGTHDGRDVIEAVLESDTARVSILNYGCVIRDWRVQTADRAVPVVLGFERFEDYPEHSRSFGILAGRVANRTAAGSFTLDGETYQLPVNNGPNHLHGGVLGLGRRLWSLEEDRAANAVELTYDSPDGEEGYPGRARLAARFTLTGGRLDMIFSAEVDRRTPINLAQHNYYNLDGYGDVRQHVLQIDAHDYTPVDEDMIPTGDVVPVGGTRLDFRQPVTVGERDLHQEGVDLNLFLNPDRNRAEPVASLWSEETGLELSLTTDQPGLQLFNAPQMQIAVPGHDGARYGPFGGICLEAQHFPDSLNKPDWPSIICSPEHPYHQTLSVEIAPL